MAPPSAALSDQLPRTKSAGCLLSLFDRFEHDGQAGSADNVPISDRSGLGRIRQPVGAGRSRPGSLQRSMSMTPVDQPGRTGPAKGDDLSKFPSESLHSFSFARQSSTGDSMRRRALQRTFDLVNPRQGRSPMSLATSASMSDSAHASPISPLTVTKPFLPLSSLADQSTSYSRPGGSDSGSCFGQDSVIGSSPDRMDVDSDDVTTSRDSGIGSGLAASKSELSLPTAYSDVFRSTESKQTSKCDAFVPQLKSTPSFPNLHSGLVIRGTAPHGNGARGPSCRQAILTTDGHEPWTIKSANDHASLLFGIQESEVRHLSVLELVQPHWRSSLQVKLESSGVSPTTDSQTSQQARPERPQAGEALGRTVSSVFGTGITARLLAKPPSSVVRNRMKQLKQQSSPSPSRTNSPTPQPPAAERRRTGSRGVLICGDVVPIQKRSGDFSSATVWMKEKHGSLIWVLEEIDDDVAVVAIDDVGCVDHSWGSTKHIWDSDRTRPGIDARKLIPALPKEPMTNTGRLDWDQIAADRFFTARTADSIAVPVTVDRIDPDVAASTVAAGSGLTDAGRAGRRSWLTGESQLLRVSSYPNIAGIVVLDAHTLTVRSANPAFSGALFGRTSPAGLHARDLIPGFERLIGLIFDDLDGDIVDGLVIPSAQFRNARAAIGQVVGGPSINPAALLFSSAAIEARHRDGSELLVDVQLRVVRDDRPTGPSHRTGFVDSAYSSPFVGLDEPEEEDLVFAVWISYSRDAHKAAVKERKSLPVKVDSVMSDQMPSPVSMLRVVTSPGGSIRTANPAASLETNLATKSSHRHARRSIDDFAVVEDMGQGAYGQVKLCEENKSGDRVVIKYVTKKRILVDTWTRDRRLGTVPSEVHILDFLNKDGMQHGNVVEMVDFFEDDNFYYIQMVPHGIPGMDLFDYIEVKTDMTEDECRNIFIQVARAIEHLHTKALVVHRDIKDENVILDGDGNIKLIDFGSAAYIRSGPFEVFVGTIDYAAPEVLGGRSYGGQEQDVWALGILLYTIIYKENPFYSVDEIMDHDLRVPYLMSDDSIDLIRSMLDRNVSTRATITKVLQHPWCRAASLADPAVFRD